MKRWAIYSKCIQNVSVASGDHQNPVPPVDLNHPPSFPQLRAGDIRVKRLARPETELPGDLFRSRRCREGSIPFSKVRATGASGRPSGRKNTIPTCCTHCCGPQ